MNIAVKPEPPEVPGAIRSRSGRQWVLITTAFRRAIYDPNGPTVGLLARKAGIPPSNLSLVCRQPFVLGPTRAEHFQLIAKVIKFDGPLYEPATMAAIEIVSTPSARPEGPPPRSVRGAK